MSGYEFSERIVPSGEGFMNSYNSELHRSLRLNGEQRDYARAEVTMQPVRVRTLSSANLFERGEHEIGIAHGESLYRLKITRQGKLILNK